MEKNYRIPYAQKVKGLFDIFAVKNVHSGERHCKFYDWKNSFIVVDFLEWVLHKVYPNQIVHLILDGWSCHKSKAFKAFADLEERLSLHYLPTCASWLNPIERDFSRIQQGLLDNSNFQNPVEAINQITQFIEKELVKSGRPT